MSYDPWGGRFLGWGLSWIYNLPILITPPERTAIVATEDRRIYAERIPRIGVVATEDRIIGIFR